MQDFMMIRNFDEIEEASEEIMPLDHEMIEVLLNSAFYYQKKYEGSLDPM